MKKTIILLSIFTLSLISCKKDVSKSETKEVNVTSTVDSNGTKKTDSASEYSKTENGKTTKSNNNIQKYEYVYKAFDGTEANITFTNGTDEGNFILIERNKLKIELPQKESWSKGAIYEKDGIKAEAQEDKLTITQNGKVFELERKK